MSLRHILSLACTLSIWIDWLALRSSCLYLLSTGILSMRYHARICTWLLGIEPQDLCLLVKFFTSRAIPPAPIFNSTQSPAKWPERGLGLSDLFSIKYSVKNAFYFYCYCISIRLLICQSCLPFFFWLYSYTNHNSRLERSEGKLQFMLIGDSRRFWSWLMTTFRAFLPLSILPTSGLWVSESFIPCLRK